MTSTGDLTDFTVRWDTKQKQKTAQELVIRLVIVFPLRPSYKTFYESNADKYFLSLSS